MHSKKQRQAVFALTALTCMWGTTFAIVQDSLPDVSPLLFAGLRFALALAIFLACFKSARKALGLFFNCNTPARKLLRRNAIILGVTLGIGYIFQFLGLVTTTTSKSAFLTTTTVLWTPIFARLDGFEKMSAKKLIGIAGAVLGIILLIHPYPIEKIVIGDVFSALCAVSFGVYILWIDKTYPLIKEEIGDEIPSVIAMSTMQLFVAFIVILIALPLSGPIYFHLTPRAEFAILYTTILATAASSFVQTYYQKEISPTSAVLIYTLEPVVTAIIGFLIVGETMNIVELGGCGLIIGAMVIGND
jgi:drug/metabolite transporter (DMT)-like permease